MQILAKSSGISLDQHSKSVAEVALYISSICKNDRLSPDIDKYIERISLLHDIGKCDPNFQEYIKADDKKREKLIKKSKYYHQEIGWAFLRNKTTLTDIELNTIYWHHGVQFPYRKFDINKRESVSDILKGMDTTDMEQYFDSIYGKSLFLNKDLNKKIPLFYDSEIDSDDKYDTSFIRMCVYSADRIVSKLESIDKVHTYKQHIDKIIKSTPFNILNYPCGDINRFNKQKEIIDQCTNNTLLKAPAGFGKTLSGLMWASKSDRKTIWVCPRNTIATSVYGDILKELNITNNSNVSVELYLTGERQTSHLSPDGSFNSDIIVTNIDNFIKPNADLKDADKLFMINNSNVIFDEFHELLSDSSLFAAFDIIANTRIRRTNSKTLFLSATPSLIINTLFPQVTILPSKISHYDPVHNKQYDLNVYDDDSTIPYGVNNKSNLFISNAIRTAQDNQDIDSYLYHSKFLSDKRVELYDNIYSDYDKKSNRVSNKKNVFGTHIIQASLDISFNNLYEYLLSPESTLQRIGRCDRWGDYLDDCSINIMNNDSQSEEMAIMTLYNKDLKDKWFNYIKQFGGTKVTLKELYDIYNQFNIINENEIKRYIEDIKSESYKYLEEVYPMKFGDYIKNDGEIINANGNKYRSTGNNIHYILQNVISGDWVGPFSERVYSSFDKQFNEDGNTLKRIKKVHKKLNNNGKFMYYKNTHQHKNMTIDQIRRMSKYSDKPYVRFDVVYDDNKGIIKKLN